uniref:Transmembrane protein n=1 Tax=Marseillevirus LCMAC103 TaxID=2506604 RepID=A0A481YV58_9VIRU|nr:MAG: hypothetical protein LCMAC103_00040 [Marseillevirus LCMAC103]
MKTQNIRPVVRKMTGCVAIIILVVLAVCVAAAPSKVSTTTALVLALVLALVAVAAAAQAKTAPSEPYPSGGTAYDPSGRRYIGWVGPLASDR